MNRKLRANFLLLTTSFIWGSAFVAQRVGMEYNGPFTFNAVRMLVAGIALTVVTLILNRNKKNPAEARESEYEGPVDPKEAKKMLYISGLVCGIILFIGSSFQQFGLLFTTAGKAGFITTLYIILVPVLGLFLRKKTGKKVWFCVLMALVGLYFLSFIEDMQFNLGDVLVLICALAYAVHIMVIDYYSRKVDSVKLSQLQFFVCAFLSFIVMFIFESPEIRNILSAWIPILYVGAISGAVGFTFQIIAQKDTAPSIAALLMSFEAVFAALTGFIILNEVLTPRELFGCVLMFAAVVIAQLPGRQSKLA